MKGPSPRVVGSLALLSALAFGLWLWLGPGAKGEWSDGQRVVGTDTELRVATGGSPAPAYAGAPAEIDSRAALSSDGRWLVWAAKGSDSGHDLFIGELRDGRLGAAAPLAALCTASDECAPAFGGEWLYFSSDRPGGVGGHDLWRARFSDGAVSAAELVPGPANTAGEELDPAPCVDSGAIVFVADRDGAGWDLYSAPLGKGATTRLDVLCSARDEREPAFTQADRALVFSSSRDGGLGGFDLYRAARFGEQYAAPGALLPLNSPQDERAPIATHDGLALSFVRSEAGAHPLLLTSPALELFRSPRRAISWMEWLALAGLLALAVLGMLVGRFPELERIYKCLLLSVILHLLLLWWFHDSWFGIGSREPEPSRAPIRVKLEPRVPLAVVEPSVIPPPEVARTSEPAQPLAQPAVTAPAESERITPTAAIPALAMALPEAAGAPATSAANAALQRLDSHARPSDPTPSAASVASAAREASSLPVRETSDLESSASTQRALATREPNAVAHSASPAPALGIVSQALGAASTASRSMGTPSHPQFQPSPGIPAASPTSGTVAHAAAPSTQSTPSRSAADAQPAARADTATIALRDAAMARADSTLQAAAPVAALELGDLAAGESQAANPQSQGKALARAELSKDQRTGATNRMPSGESVARKAAVVGPSGGASRPRSEFAPSTESHSRGADVSALSPAPGTEVSSSATQAPALGLESLEHAPQSDSRPAGASTQGPQRATSADASPPAAATSARQNESLASRPQAPASGLPRAADALAGSAPARTDRALALADAPDSVAMPATPAGSGGSADWLSGLAAQNSSPQQSSAPQPAGPERAQSPERPSKAEPRETNTSSLARAPQPPSEEQPKPAKSDWDSTPYKNRSGSEKARALKLYGGSERTEAAVARGLEYLARIQHQSGAWGDVNALDDKYGRIAIGKTALCTLAFLGAGHTPESSTQHSLVVARALEFLLSVQDSQSGHFGDASAYDHGIATYAIAECFALTHEPRLRSALEPAIAHVLAMQSRRDDDRFRGGWGYYFADGSLYDPWSRTSITAWQVMALESARLSGLAVPDGAFDAARQFLDHAEDKQLGAYRYNHDPERLHSVYATLPASTPAALFALALLGEDIADGQHATARQYVQDRAPDGYRYSGEDDFVHLGRGNPYFWYYGTLAMFRLGGEGWQRWNAALQESLLPAQARDGSWQPLDVYARYARDDAADKSYTSALCVLSLEVYYRYYLPLLKVH